MKKQILFFILCILFFNNTYAWLEFSKIFPNTIDDINLEYLEVLNNSNSIIDFSWYSLKDKSGKEYIFETGSILLWNWTKKYYRSDTKITLNNSNENLYLYNSKWFLIDSYSYLKSVKWEVINILNEQIAVINTKNIEVPDIIYNFQSPTYLLEKKDIVNTYNCENREEKCKINLDLRESFSSKYSENNYECIINYWFKNLKSTKCNPWSIEIPLWTHYVNIKIYENNNENNFKKIQFKIINKWYLSQEVEKSLNNKIKNSDLEPRKAITINKPEIIIQSWLNINKQCINIKNCWINLNYYIQNELEKCLWNFWNWIFIWWDNQKCNPGYVKFWEWRFVIKLKVYEKWRNTNFNENELIFTNWNIENQEIKKLKAKVLDVIDGDTIEIKILDTWNIERLRLVWIDSPETKHPDKEIEKYWKEAYEFTKKVLLWKQIEIELDQFSEIDMYDRLLWYVYLNDISFNKIMLSEWYAKVYLRYDFKYTKEYIKAEKVAKEKEIWLWANSEELNIFKKEIIVDNNDNNFLKSNISIQWKIWTNKVLNWNTITCYNTCSINFDWSNSTWNIKKYSWDFWNWEKYEWVNPGYINYDWFWEYKVYLSVISETWDIDIWEFNINFIKIYKKKKSKLKISQMYAGKEKSNITDYDNLDDNKKLEQEKSTNWDYTVLLYVLIVLFSLILVVLILRKESLL